ncbi:hypothetical protein SISSUDRAFT_1103587 [Sistotremastrum suecicum HHB10207 ss-3]|uniref:Uncharacterized protein n=1 Tax=Sistotremastrum suecicum HHB10207 ss-3 TaxID=1314776 RepID=A0A166D7E7_9AGAM|nr:hypothetical protein SISSUDRAFT_1103587 [Sistotremastrum suecicum HHB10207 ss-3]
MFEQSRYLPIIAEIFNVTGHYWLANWLLGTPIATASMQVRDANGILTNEPVPGIFLCDVTFKRNFFWAYWIPILIFETIVFVLMAHKAIKKWGIKILQPEQNPTLGEKLVAVLFFDSFIFYISVLSIFTTMTFLFRFTSEDVFNTALGLTFGLISILANRMLLNLPALYDKTRLEEGTPDATLSLVFAGHQNHVDVSVSSESSETVGP